MKKPLEILFIGMQASDALETAAQAKAAKLDQLASDIMACRVTIELADKHKHQGQTVTVRVDVTLPGRELTVGRVHDEDAYVALRDAFDAMKRQLQQAVQRARGEVKLHAPRASAAPTS